jgi:hypothetical protein
MARDLAQEQRWRDRIEECCQSGLSIQSWCVQNRLKKTAYHYWARKFKLQEPQKAEDNSFAEVVLLPKLENSFIWRTRTSMPNALIILCTA